MEKKLILAIQLVVGFEWLWSGLGKLRQGQELFAAEFFKTINFFASKNPFVFYKNFLIEFAIPNAKAFSYLIPWSEFLAGAVLLVASILLLVGKKSIFFRLLSIAALIGLIFMNINFWFAAGWTSPSTKGFNLVLGLIEAVLLFFWFFNTDKSKI